MSSRTKVVGFVRRPSTRKGLINWGVVQLVRASVLYTGSRGFKSRRPNNLLYLQYGSQKRLQEGVQKVRQEQGREAVQSCS